MQKLDRLSKVGIVAIVVLVVFGGAGIWWWSQQPPGPAEADPPPTPTTAVTPMPSCDPGTDPCTPEVAAEQAELKKLRAEAERAYRDGFAEYVRLSNEGGALEPSPALVENAHGQYLEMLMKLLRDQREKGVVTSGSSTTQVRAASPGGEREGEDPRLTMEVCEDNSQSTWRDGAGEHPSASARGKVFAAVVEGRVKVVGADIEDVESCADW